MIVINSASILMFYSITVYSFKIFLIYQNTPIEIIKYHH